MQIAIHGQLYLRPPGMEPFTSGERLDEQRQDVDAEGVGDETFNEDEGDFIGVLEEEDEDEDEEFEGEFAEVDDEEEEV